MKKTLLMLMAFAGLSSAWAGTSGNVIVKPESGKTYSDIRISTAFDGTTYMSRLVALQSSPGTHNIWEVLKSTDGITWTTLFTDSVATSFDIRAADICAAGANVTDFKLFIAASYKGTGNDTAALLLAGLDPNTGIPTGILLTEQYHYVSSANRGFDQVALASDWRMPAAAASPYSITLAVEKSGPSDSVIAWTDAAGGTALHRTSYYGTGSYIESLSLAVGSIHRRGFGMLGIAWDERNSGTADYGLMNVLLADSDDGTTGSTGDGLYSFQDVNSVYLARRPGIAISQTNVAQDTGIGGADYRVSLAWETDGFGNSISYVSHDSFINAPSNQTFNYLGEATPDTASQFSPYVTYDPAGQQFYFTYYDAMTEKMPLRRQKLHTPALSLLDAVNTNYRTAGTPMTNEVAPRLSLNPGSQSVVYGAWDDEGSTLFTPVLNTTGIATPLAGNAAATFGLYPNPANDLLRVKVQAENAGTVKLDVVDMSGRILLTRDANTAIGSNEIPVQVSSLAAGTYLVKLSGAVSGSAPFTVVE